MTSSSRSQQPRKFINENGVNKLNPDYLQWRKKQGNTTTSSCSEQPPQAIIDKMNVHVTVVQGQDLCAKDRNMFGKKTSDPFVTLSFCSSPPTNRTREQQSSLGRTTTIKKNLSPIWNHSVAFAIPYELKDHTNRIVFNIYDEDILSSDDSMGVVSIPVAFQDSVGDASAAVWYEIPKNSAKNACGKIQIQVQTSLHRLTPYC